MEILEKAAALAKQGKPFALATIVSSSGSTPRNRAKMIVLSESEIIGTIGGGTLERLVIKEALEAIRFDRPKIVDYSLDREGKATSIDMDCGGSMQVFLEPIHPGPRLLIVGGGHVSLELAKTAAAAGFRIAIVEEREEFCNPARFPMASELFLGTSLDQAMEDAPADEKTFVVIATSSSDERALRYYINKKSAFLGMLGSRRKVKVVLGNLIREGVAKEKLQALRAPIGLDIGAETPEEIAISITAELLTVRTGRKGQPLSGEQRKRIVVRGAGDIATGTICRLHRAGFEVAALETAHPTVIRRTVSFAEAIFEGSCQVEGITARRADNIEAVEQAFIDGQVPVIPDPEGIWIPRLKPIAVVDAILAKKNLGTFKTMAPAVIGLGPGFEAGGDVDAVVETQRGHHLGRVILQGKAAENSGVPGTIAGFSSERVLRAPLEGEIHLLKKIGDLVEPGDPILIIRHHKGVGEDTPVKAPIGGMIRGLIREGSAVTEGFKIGDIDPRGKEADYQRVSDKAWAVAGGVLEAVLALSERRKK